MFARVEGWFEERFPQKRVGVLEVGYAMQIDWCQVRPEVDRKSVLK